MRRVDPVEKWLDMVAYSSSGSQSTREHYQRHFHSFLDHAGVKPEQIERDYARGERGARRKYTDLLKSWIGILLHEGNYTNSSIQVMVAAVQSFFKHSDFPLGYVPQAQSYIVYHNRDITREEIALILSIAKPRDKAAFCMIAQTGLRPHTLCRLKLKHLEPDFSNGRIPCLVRVPQEIAKGRYSGHFTFMPEESVKYLKNYFTTRGELSPDSLLFTMLAHQDREINRKVLGSEFYRLVRLLRANKQLDFGQKEPGKPGELRLYCLRKFFKKYSHQAGEQISEFWMGHKGRGTADNYRADEPDWHRKLYAEKAMPFLRIEQATPTEAEKTVQEQQQRIDRLEQSLKKQQELLSQMATLWYRGQKEDVAEEIDGFLDKLAKSHYPDYETAEERIKRLSRKKQ